MATEGLARLFDLEHQISDGSSSVHPVNIGSNAYGVTFLCSVPGGGSDTFTLKACATRGGSYTAIAAISRYYTKATLDGTSQWTDSGDLGTPVSAVTLSAGQVAFFVNASDVRQLNPSWGPGYLEVVPGDSGMVTAVMHDLAFERNPKYLPALNA